LASVCRHFHSRLTQAAQPTANTAATVATPLEQKPKTHLSVAKEKLRLVSLTVVDRLHPSLHSMPHTTTLHSRRKYCRSQTTTTSLTIDNNLASTSAAGGMKMTSEQNTIT